MSFIHSFKVKRNPTNTTLNTMFFYLRYLVLISFEVIIIISKCYFRLDGEILKEEIVCFLSRLRRHIKMNESFFLYTTSNSLLKGILHRWRYEGYIN